MRELYAIKQEVKQKELAGARKRWFLRYMQLGNAMAVCREFGIHRSKFYYWKKRLDLKSRPGATFLLLPSQTCESFLIFFAASLAISVKSYAMTVFSLVLLCPVQYVLKSVLLQ